MINLMAKENVTCRKENINPFLNHAFLYKLHLNEWCNYYSIGIRSNIKKDSSFS